MVNITKVVFCLFYLLLVGKNQLNDFDSGRFAILPSLALVSMAMVTLSIKR